MQFNLSGFENSTNGTFKKETINNLTFVVNADRVIQIKNCLFIFNRVNNGALVEIRLTNDEYLIVIVVYANLLQHQLQILC